MPATLTPAAFITIWREVSGSERANYQLFITDLCDLLGTDKPDPAREDTRDNACVFERRVQFAHGDVGESLGVIDCHKRGAFVLEAKKIKVRLAAVKMLAVAAVLHGAGTALSEVEVAAYFMGRGAWKRRLPQVIDPLVALGLARKAKGKVQSV